MEAENEDKTISRHICWSHTMKVLSLNVTSVRRNSAGVVNLRHICFVMKVWSRMLVQGGPKNGTVFCIPH